MEKRAVSEPFNEKVVRGSRESFIEDIETNLTLVRRRIKSSSLKTEDLHYGSLTKTTVYLVYLEGICAQELVDEVKARLSHIELDGVLEKIQTDLSKVVGWGATQVIVVGKEYAQQGIVPILEFVAREPNIRLKNYIFVAPRKAKEVSDIKAILERFPQEIIRKYARGRITLATTIKDCLVAQSFGGGMAIPILKMGKKTLKSEEKPELTWVGNDDIALFRNAMMVGDIPHVDRLGVKWLKNRMLNDILTVSSPTDGKLMSFFVNRTQTKIKPEWGTDFYAFRVTVNVQFMMISSDSSIDMSSMADVKKVESALEKDIRKRMEGAFNASKKIGADTFQLGEYLKLYYPNKWKGIKADWPQEYKSKAKLEAIIDAKVRRIGAEKKTIWKLNDQIEGESS